MFQFVYTRRTNIHLNGKWGSIKAHSIKQQLAKSITLVICMKESTTHLHGKVLLNTTSNLFFFSFGAIFSG